MSKPKLLVVAAVVCFAAWNAALAHAASSTPTPGFVAEPALSARLDSGGTVAQVYAKFTLTNTAARPRGLAHAVSVTIGGFGALVRPDSQGGVRWTATLIGAAGQDFQLGHRYRVTVNACGSHRCVGRTFTEPLSAAR